MLRDRGSLYVRILGKWRKKNVILVTNFGIYSLVTGEKWPALKTTFGVNVFGSAFHDRPRTQVLYSRCQDGANQRGGKIKRSMFKSQSRAHRSLKLLFRSLLLSEP